MTRFRQVLVNLLSKAVKFTAHGEVVLRVRTDGDQPGGGVVLHVAVVDTGIGIPADRLASLFKSFSQVDASTTRSTVAPVSAWPSASGWSRPWAVSSPSRAPAPPGAPSPSP